MKLFYLILFFCGLVLTGSSSFEEAEDALQKGELDKAQILLEETLIKEPENRKALIEQAYVYYRQGEVEKTKLLLQNILNNSYDTAAALMLADLFYKTKDFAKARDLYLKIEEVNPDIRIVNIRLYELFRYEDREKAHRYYLNSLQLSPSDIEEYLGLPKDIYFDFEYNSSVRKYKRTETNEIIKYLESDTEEDNATNMVVLAQTKVKPLKKIRLFRSVKKEKIISRFFVSIFVILLFFIVNLVRQNRLKKGFNDIIISTYRKS